MSKINWARAKRFWTPWLFLVPTLIVILVLDLYPFFTIWDFSLRSWSFGHPESMGEPVGLLNYFRMMHDMTFWDSIKVTLTIFGIALPVEFFLGFFVALVLYHKVSDRIRKILIIPLLIPLTTAPVVVGLVFKYIFQGDFGVFTYYANLLGYFREGSVLGSPNTVLPAVTIVEVWHWTFFIGLILLAGLLALPREPYEAAAMDGATSWMKFKYITFPFLKPLMGIVVILRAMDLMRLFDELYILTGGGPGTSSESLMMYTYRTNFVWWDFGFGGAVSLFFFTIILLMSLVFFDATSRKD